MALLNLTALAISATITAGLSGMTPTGIASASSIHADTTQVVLTADALSRMTTFWATFMKESPLLRDVARQNNQKQIQLSLALGNSGQPQVFPLVAVDMVAMAAQYPSVVADFKQAHLTPEEWEQLRLSLFTALVTEQALKAQGSGVPASSSVVGQNIVFLHTHQRELDALKATGMWIPRAKAQGADDGSDLDP